ncbi:protein ALTERED PHOSPHATE STARVATION RESPONSE 1 [Sesamum angolense]|uniref:Protein ALTERED PHOSPHATE STARVATION RESPONSE 1 n=1 Tax=Sesamum angolense TaxID=2727404 RepID=A0AAE2BQC4_9LAMI|nr:protein ALTERED PHOSPHATE STARVATION RESPONSE 1 [Sesamum angolense]
MITIIVKGELIENVVMKGNYQVDSLTYSFPYPMIPMLLLALLLEFVHRLMSMWRSMYEFHQVQTHIVQQLKYLNCIPSTDPTSEIHRQSTLQLELEAQQWHLSFCNLMKAQRDYIQSLTGWLRLSLFQVGNNPISKTKQDSAIYSFCEEWQLTINNAPDKVASEGIKSFLSMIHAIVVQQAEEQKQKRRSESVFKELEEGG